MIKKYITSIAIVPYFCILMTCIGTIFYPAHTRIFSYISIVIMIPLLIFELIKKRKEDKLEGTKHFQHSVYNILIAAAMIGVLFFLISQN